MLRTLIAPFFTFLSYEHATLMSGLVWGQKNMLMPEHYELFKTTGLLHLLVLSGQNIALLSEFVAVILKSIQIKRIFILTGQAGVAAFYLLIFSSEPSIVRASIMTLILITSKINERNTHSVFILLITTAFMLFVKPEWFRDISFWLSISSTAGILTIYPHLVKNKKNALIESFLLALSAQLATLPITLTAFRELNLLALPMNVAVSWLIEPIMVLGVVLSLTGSFIPFFGSIIGFLLNGLILTLLVIIKVGYSMSSAFIFRF